MLDYNEIIEDSNAFKIISQDVVSERISHAYLFVTEDSDYLTMFCEKVSKLLINHNESQNIEKNNLRIEKHVHPDVKFFGTGKDIIDSDTVTNIVEESNFSPFEADKKIFVLNGVEMMNESSQNKILKTLEEPPKNTYFILAASSTSKLLPTILSRVKMIELDKISIERIAKMLENIGVKKDRAEIVASCSCENATHAERLAVDAGFIEFFDDIVSCFFEINGSRDVLKFSSKFSAKSIDKEEFIDVFMMITRDLLMILTNQDNLVINKNILPKLKVISSMLSIDTLTQILKLCINCKKNLNFNVNGTAIVDILLFKLAEEKVKCRK